MIPKYFGTKLTTRVEVTYERTALDAAANEHVTKLAESDKNAGLDWARRINAYLAKAKAPSTAPTAH